MIIHQHFVRWQVQLHIYKAVMIMLYTVRHENFTQNLYIWFYGQWQNRKIKICKLHGNLPHYCHEIEHETGLCKIKIHQLLMYTIWRQTVNITVKFSCHTVLCTYIHIAMYSYYIYQMSKLLCNVLLLQELFFTGHLYLWLHFGCCI